MNITDIPTTEQIALSDDPLDIIMTGQSITQIDVDYIVEHGTTNWVIEPCDYVDCNRWVLIAVDHYDQACDLMVYRDVEDDCLLACCDRHVSSINNWPRLAGPTDISHGLDCIRRAVISEFQSDDRVVK